MVNIMTNNILKRVPLMFMTFLILIMGVNAVTILDSCGKNSGWLDNETYLINITNVDNAYLNNYCFDISGDFNNITFRQVSEQIIYSNDLVGNTFSILQFRKDSITTFERLENSIIENFNIYVDTPDRFNFIQLNGFGGVLDVRFSNNLINNNTINYVQNNNQDNYFIYMHQSQSGSARIENNEINNNYINGGGLYYGHYGFQNLGSRYYVFNNNSINSNLAILQKDRFNISNSILIRRHSGSSGDSVQIINNTINNNVFVDYTNEPIIFIETGNAQPETIIGNLFSSNMYAKHKFNDTNNNNIADTNEIIGLYGFVLTNSNIYKDLFGYRFIQDFKEGAIGYTTSTGLNLVLINDLDNIGIGTEIYSPATNNNLIILDYLGSSFQELNGFRLINSNTDIDCSLISSERCVINDADANGVASLNKFKSYIATKDDVSISRLQFDLLNESNTFISGIANADDNEYFGFNLINSRFDSAIYNFVLLNPLIGGEAESEDYLYPNLKLKYSGATINNNFFYGLDNPSGTQYVYMYIDSTNPSTNNVYANTFSNLIINPDSPSCVFGFKAETNFFYNYIGSNITILCDSNPTNNASYFEIDYSGSNLDVNGYARYYNEFDNSIYYFLLGNYYEDNTGCVDGNFDDICDSPYNDSTMVDPLPLAVYPYDFAGHLGDAEFSISNDYNINLVDIVNGQTITIPTLNSGIVFKFSQDSGISNLVCEMLIDDINIDTIYNPNNGTIYSTTKFNWAVDSYEYKVKCYDPLVPETLTFSEIIVFNVALGDDNGGGDIGEPITGTNLDIGNLFSDDPNDSVDSLVGLFNLTGGFIGYLIILGIIGIFVGIILLGFAFVGKIIR